MVVTWDELQWRRPSAYKWELASLGDWRVWRATPDNLSDHPYQFVCDTGNSMRVKMFEHGQLLEAMCFLVHIQENPDDDDVQRLAL